MNEQQRIAIENPCRLAGETVHPRFKRVYRNGLSVIVTVNYGYE